MDLVLVTADAGSHPQTSHVSLETLGSTQSTDESVDARTSHTNMELLDLLPTIEVNRIKRHTYVSMDLRYTLQGPYAVD